MPTPFMCHGCDSPTMNKSGVCDNCNIEIKLDNTLPDTKYVNFLSDEEIMELDNIDEVSFEYLDNMQDYESYKKSIEDISKSIYGKSKVGMRYSWRHINSAEKKKKRSKK